MPGILCETLMNTPISFNETLINPKAHGLTEFKKKKFKCQRGRLAIKNKYRKCPEAVGGIWANLSSVPPTQHNKKCISCRWFPPNQSYSRCFGHTNICRTAGDVSLWCAAERISLVSGEGRKWSRDKEWEKETHRLFRLPHIRRPTGGLFLSGSSNWGGQIIKPV